MFDHDVIGYDNDSHADKDRSNETYYNDGRDYHHHATNDIDVACFVFFDLDY